VKNKISALEGNAIDNELKAFAPLSKTKTFDNTKEFSEH